LQQELKADLDANNLDTIAEECIRVRSKQRVQDFLKNGKSLPTKQFKRSRIELGSVRLDKDAMRRLARLAYELAHWSNEKGKLPQLKKPKPARLRDCATHVQEMLQNPTYNPALADGKFDKWQFWRLPELLNRMAELSEKCDQRIRDMSQEDYYRDILLLCFKREYKSSWGVFTPAKASRLLSAFG
jgi:hypothetical protein